MWHKKLQHKHKSASLEFGLCMTNTDHTKMENLECVHVCYVWALAIHGKNHMATSDR
jgi:hypothetical protein